MGLFGKNKKKENDFFDDFDDFENFDDFSEFEHAALEDDAYNISEVTESIPTLTNENKAYKRETKEVAQMKYDNQELMRINDSLHKEIFELRHAQSAAEKSTTGELEHLKSENIELQREKMQLTKNIEQLKEKLRKVQAVRPETTSKEIISEVLIDARVHAKEMIDEAQKEVEKYNQLIAERKVTFEQLNQVSQLEKNYFEKISQLHVESKALHDKIKNATSHL
jgi:chromosome segregation ATPase